jgi:hypothetical protein
MRVLVGLVGLICASCAVGQEPDFDPKGTAAIERSQQTTATYSLYSWNDVPDGQGIEDGWSAEFHSGDLHRVESPMSRSVADCKKRTGTNLNLKTGKIISNHTVSNAACGINTNFQFRAVEWLGRHKTTFGDADRVRITDDNSILTYDVLDNGVLVSTIVVDRQGKPLVTNSPIALLATVPEGIFSEESLQLSVVPEKYRKPPVSR